MSSTATARAEAPRSLAPHVALLVVQTCFGLSPIFVKWACAPGAFTPFAVGVWRMLFGGVVLAACAWLWFRPRFRVEARDLPRLVACALLGVVVNMTLYLEGLARSTAVNAGLVMCLIPVFTFLVAAALRQEPFRAVRALGIAVSLVGASLLFWAERPELIAAHGLGNALMALNTLCYACYLVLVRPLTRRYPPLVVIAWVFVLSAAFTPLLVLHSTLGSELPPGAAVEQFLAPAQADQRAVLALVFVLIFPTTLAYFLNSFALARVRASTTAVYVYLQPIVTAVAGILLLGEELTGVMLLSGALVFLGIFLVVRPPEWAGSAATEPP